MREELFNNIETLSKFFYFKKKALKEKIFEDLESLFNRLDFFKKELEEKESIISELNNNLNKEIEKGVRLENLKKELEIKNSELNNKLEITFEELKQKKEKIDELNSIVFSRNDEIAKLKNLLQEEIEKSVKLQNIKKELENELNLLSDLKKLISSLQEKEIINDIDELAKIEDLKYILDDIKEYDLINLDDDKFLENVLSAFEEIIYQLKEIIYDLEDIEEFLELDNQNHIENIKESYSFLSELFKELMDLKIGKDIDEIVDNIKEYKKAYEYLNYLKNFEKDKLSSFNEFKNLSKEIIKHKNVFEAIELINDLYKNFDFEKAEKIENEIFNLDKNLSYIIDLIKQSVLISKIIKKDKISFEEIENEFESLKNILISNVDAEIIKKIEDLKEQIIDYKLFPFKKSLKIGVGGSFASGKTQFLQGIVGKNIKLPIADTPTTAVATYFYYNSKLSIKAFNVLNTQIEISENEFNIFNNHEKVKNFNINYFIKFFIIGNHKIPYKNLSFIDVPGYNPAKNSSTKDDFLVATKYLKDSDTIFWVISIERGTLEDSDIKFLKQFDKKIYLIINKSDLRDEKTRKEVLEEVKEKLEENNLDYIGISLFNSIEFKELGFYKTSLLAYLKTLNKQKSSNLNSKINSLFNEIKEAFYIKINSAQQMLKSIDEIEWDLTENFYHEKNKRREIEYKFDDLKQIYKNEIEKNNYFLQEIEKIKTKISQFAS